jgi:hypothetical protein
LLADPGLRVAQSRRRLLRYLGSLFGIASERGSTIVFPFPIELARVFAAMGEKEG